MSTHDLPQEPELVVQSCKAAYCARHLEDLIQTAALACWKHQRQGRPVAYCFLRPIGWREVLLLQNP